MPQPRLLVLVRTTNELLHVALRLNGLPAHCAGIALLKRNPRELRLGSSAPTLAEANRAPAVLKAMGKWHGADAAIDISLDVSD